MVYTPENIKFDQVINANRYLFWKYMLIVHPNSLVALGQNHDNFEKVAPLQVFADLGRGIYVQSGSA